MRTWSRKEIERMREYQRERRTRRSRELEEKLQKAREDCRRIVETLVEGHELSRIWQCVYERGRGDD
jgi:hypothetical protein